jgi:hypothetical protein
MLLGIHRAHLVHRLADHVEHPAQRLGTHGHFHGMAQADGLHAAHQALGGLQRDGAHAAFADVLLHFADDVDGVGGVESLAGHADGRVNQGNLPLGKFAVHSRSRTWTTLPVTIALVVAISILNSLLRASRAAHHFDDFLGDAGLAHAVHVQCQLLDHVPGVGGGRVHRRHARRMLGAVDSSSAR